MQDANVFGSVIDCIDGEVLWETEAGELRRVDREMLYELRGVWQVCRNPVQVARVTAAWHSQPTRGDLRRMHLWRSPAFGDDD